MSSVFSRIVAVGIVAGGFTLTGDLGRLATRGLEVINARDVPAARAEAAAESRGEPSPASDAGSAAALPADAPAALAADARSPGAAAVSPVGASAATTGVASGTTLARDTDFRPPRDGLGRVDLAELAAGDRLAVWLAVARRSGGRAYRCLVFDVVDPTAADALLSEAAPFAADGRPRATAAPPHRVRLHGDGPGGTVVAGGMIEVQPRGAATDAAMHETIGPVAALEIIR